MTRSTRLLKIVGTAFAAALVVFVWSQAGPPRASAVFDDTDGDGAIDIAEVTAGSDPSDPRSIPETTGTEIVAGYAACSDGLDNDADGLTDVEDPGCTDSDGDLVADPGEILYGSDPTNASSFPEDSRLDAILEYYGIPIFFCGDSADNDGDGLTDGDDPGCAPIRGDSDGFDDATEKRFGSDPADANSVPEHDGPNPGSCADGMDNDLDGLTDAADPACGTPANDNRANATVVSALPYADGPSIAKNATGEPNEPRSGCSFGSVSASIWYRYTASADGVLIADSAGSNFDTILAVWQESGSGLTEVDCDYGFNAPESQARIAFRVSAGETYFFQLSSYPYGTRTMPTLGFHLTVGTPPANDGFAALTAITDLPYADAVDTSAATTQFGEPVPSCSGDIQSTVWYRFTPAQDAVLVAETTGSDHATAIGVWTDSKFGLTAVTCATSDFFVPGFAELPARVAVQAEGGRTYYFQVGGAPYGRSSGNLAFHLETGAAPANDDFANATAVTALPFTDTVDTLTASAEPGEPAPSCIYGATLRQTIWYRYTPASDGYVRADTGETYRYDLVVAAYEGSSLSDLTEVACAQPYSPANYTAFPIIAGRTYYVLVGSQSYSGLSGDVAPPGPIPPPLPGSIVTLHLDTLSVPDCATPTFAYTDAIGDTFGFLGPPLPGPQPPDFSSITGGNDGRYLCLDIQFAAPLTPPVPGDYPTTLNLNFDAVEPFGQQLSCFNSYDTDLYVYLQVPGNLIFQLYPYFSGSEPPPGGYTGYSIVDESSVRVLIPMEALGGDDAFRFTASASNRYGSDCAPDSGTIQSPYPAIPGDANCDGSTNSVDSLLILQLFARLIGSIACQTAGDVNINGDVGPIDAVLILQYESGMLATLPMPAQ